MCIPHDYEIEDMLKAEQDLKAAATALNDCNALLNSTPKIPFRISMYCSECHDLYMATDNSGICDYCRMERDHV
jgi:hypothetical protein